ncbi:MAG: ATP-binding protein [Bacteroidota bacterium]
MMKPLLPYALWMLSGFVALTAQASCTDPLNPFLKDAKRHLQDPTRSAEEKSQVIQDLVQRADELEREGCEIGAARTWQLVGIYYDITQQSDSLEKYYVQSLSRMDALYKTQKLEWSLKDSSDYAVLLNNYARILSQREEWRTALIMADRSLDLLMIISDPPNLGPILRTIGYINGSLGNTAMAILYYKQSLEAFKPLEKYKRDVLALYTNLTLCFSQLQNLDSALFYGHQLLAINNGEYPQSELTAYQNMGGAYGNVDSLKMAEAMLIQAVQYMQSHGTQAFYNSTPISLYQEWASIKLQQGKATQALSYLQLAQTYFYAQMSTSQKIMVWADMADTWLALSELDSAAYYQAKVIKLLQEELAKRSKSTAEQTSLFYLLSEAGVENHSKEYEIDKARIANQQMTIGLLLTGLIITLLLVYLRYIHFKHKAALKQTLLEADQKIGQAIVKIYREEQDALTEERNHLGKILHESIQGQLSISKMLVQNVEEAIESDQERIKDHLNLIKRNLENSNERVRQISHQLKDGEPYQEQYEGRLTEDLRRIVNPYRATGLFKEIRLDVDISTAEMMESQLILPSKLKTDIVFWVQGLLTNVIKHSGADKVCIELRKEDDTLKVKVSDNGIGMVNDWKSQAGSSGLRDLLVEVTGYKGELEIQSPEGTAVGITIPLPHVDSFGY